ncbi:MAG: TIGR00296 family protein [Candidatus Micrarchaeia archaeon]
MVSLQQGEFLVKLARDSVSTYLKNGQRIRPTENGFDLKKQGVFVTLQSFPERVLRGCIGFPYPVKRLDEAVVEMALAAAFQDPRFPPLQKGELQKVVFEISVLTVPKALDVEAARRAEKVRVGFDGLTIEKEGCSGLLLPQVATEQGWQAEEFLRHVCLKAGLDSEVWLDETAKVCAFQAQVFAEQKPEGSVVEKKIV